MRSWLVALRIARREARRAKGRTALIVTMIALPVLALTFAVATYDSYELTPQEQATRMMGTADGIAQLVGVPDASGQVTDRAPGTVTPGTVTDLLALFPAGTRASHYWHDAVTVHTAGGIGGMDSYGIDTTDPMTRGMVVLRSGRVPVADNQVAVSPAALARLGVRVGDTITTITGPADADYPAHVYTVVGTVEIGGDLGQDLLFRPSQRPRYEMWLVTVPVPPIGRIDADQLGTEGVSIQTRDSVLHPPRGTSTNPRSEGFSVFGIGTLIGGLGLLEVVLLAGPAFTVGARRRQRDLALVATAGGTPGVLRRIVLADGVISGLVASVAGVVLGLIVAASSRGFLEEHLTQQRFGAYRAAPVALVAISALAVLTGVLGALVPAFTAGRQDVVAALSGRRGIVRSRAVWLLLGLAGVGTGGLVAVAGAVAHSSDGVLAGLVIGELGLVLCTPTLVALVARLGRFLPIAPRIALRDTARRRAAAAPAISAVMAAVAGSVALTVYLGASAGRAPEYRAALPIGTIAVPAEGGAASRTRQVGLIDTAIASVLPTATAITVDTYDCADSCQIQPALPVARRCPYPTDRPLSKADQSRARSDPRCADGLTAGTFDNTFLPSAVTDDPHVVAAILGITGRRLADATAVLRAGGVIVTDDRYVTGGMVALDVTQYDDSDTETGGTTTSGAKTSGTTTTRTVTLPGQAVASGLALTTILSPTALTRLDLPARTYGVLATPSHLPTQKERDALNASLLAAQLDSAYVEDGPPSKHSTVALILAIAAGVIALGAASIATGLAAADGRADLSTLAAVGATPRVRRVLSLSQSGVIAGLGSLLGAVAGFGAAAAVLTGLNQVYAKDWPAPAPYPIDVPWLNLGISLVAVPVIAMAGAGLFTRSRLPSERRAD